MKTLKPLSIAFLIIVLTAFKAGLPTAFTALLYRAHIDFTVPAQYTEAPITKNSQMNYDFALKHPGKNFEIRYPKSAVHSVSGSASGEIRQNNAGLCGSRA